MTEERLERLLKKSANRIDLVLCKECNVRKSSEKFRTYSRLRMTGYCELCARELEMQMKNESEYFKFV